MQSFYSKLKSVFKSDGSESNCCAWATLKKIAVPAGVWEKNCTLGFLLLGFQIATFPHSSRQCFFAVLASHKKVQFIACIWVVLLLLGGAERKKTTQNFMGNLQYFSSSFKAQFMTISQAYQLDILLKTQAEKTKTQEHEHQNSRIFLQKLSIPAILYHVYA